MVKYILGTSCFWLLVFSFGTLYALFSGMEIRLPAATPEAAAIESIFDVADNTPMSVAKHKKH